MLHLSLYVVVPVNVYLIFNCNDVILIVLGEKWISLVPYLAILCISCISYVYTNLHMTTFKTIGKTKNLFISETVRKSIGLFVIVITIPHGVMVMVYGLLAYSVLDVVVSSFFLNHCIAVGVVNQIKAATTPVLFSLASGGMCWILSFAFPDIYVRIVINIFTFAGIYTLLSIIFKEQGISFLKNYFK